MRLAILLVSVICASAGAGAQDISATLLSGRTFSCSAADPGGLKSWPCQITFSGSPSKLSGEISWTTLSSIHRFAGALSGSSLKFTEVAAVKAGSAHMNTSYDLVLSNGRFTGRYQDRDGCSGMMAIEIGAAASSPKAPPGTAAVDPPQGTQVARIDLNGSWQDGLLHIWQDGANLLVTATWKRADGKWVIWRGTGRLNSRSAVLDEIVYSPMPHGPQAPVKGYFSVSNDANVIEAYYVIDGRRDPQNFQYHRDR